MKASKWIIAILVLAIFAVFALGSGEDSTTTQGTGAAATKTEVDGEIGKYTVIIDSCRLAKSYDGKPVVCCWDVLTK